MKRCLEMQLGTGLCLQHRCFSPVCKKGAMFHSPWVGKSKKAFNGFWQWSCGLRRLGKQAGARKKGWCCKCNGFAKIPIL